MNIEFRNLVDFTEDDYLAFRDDGIIYHFIKIIGLHHMKVSRKSVLYLELLNLRVEVVEKHTEDYLKLQAKIIKN